MSVADISLSPAFTITSTATTQLLAISHFSGENVISAAIETDNKERRLRSAIIFFIAYD
jgi:hypothetical protein